MIPRCFVRPEEWAKTEIRLPPADSHHFIHVLRLSAGSRIVVCDGQGGESLCEVRGGGGSELVVRVIERRVRSSSSSVSFSLIQAIPKGARMEWILEKAAELGVWSVFPIMTERGVVRLEGTRAAGRRERWQRVVTEAAKQCRTAWIPRVEAIEELKDLLGRSLPFEALLVGSLEPAAAPLKQAIQEMKGKGVRSVALIIGPEGDLTAEELDASMKAGARAVSFGERVLRVETAAIYGLSVLAHEFGVG